MKPDVRGKVRSQKKGQKSEVKGQKYLLLITYYLFLIPFLAAVLFSCAPEPCYPDPVCEMCGQVLDGSHTPWCTPEWEALTTSH